MADLDPGHSSRNEEIVALDAPPLNDPGLPQNDDTSSRALSTAVVEPVKAGEETGAGAERKVDVQDARNGVSAHIEAVNSTPANVTKNEETVAESPSAIVIETPVNNNNKLPDMVLDQDYTMPAPNRMPTPPQEPKGLSFATDVVDGQQPMAPSSPALAVASVLIQQYNDPTLTASLSLMPHDPTLKLETDLPTDMDNLDLMSMLPGHLPADPYISSVSAEELHAAEMANDMYSQQQQEARISAYAKLAFDYGYDFYMNTFSIIIGREETAAQEEARRLQQQQQIHDNRFGPNAMLSAQTPNGASLSPGLAALESPYIKKEKKKGRKSNASTKKSSSSSHLNSRNQPSTPGTAQQLAPDMPVDEILTIRHPDGRPVKNISRRHARIAYNFETRKFDIQVLGKNGIFVDGRHYKTETIAPLENASKVTLGRVEFQFLLPDTADEPEEDGLMKDANEHINDDGMQGMSLTFEDENGNEIPASAFSEPVSDSDGNSSSNSEDEDGDDEDEDESHEVAIDGGATAAVKSGSNASEEPSGQEDGDQEDEGSMSPSNLAKPAKRGRGRPPKNGVISVREQKQLAKREEAERVAAKKTKEAQKTAVSAVKVSAKTTAKANAKTNKAKEQREKEKEEERRQRQLVKEAAEREKEQRRLEKEAEKVRIAQMKEEKRQQQQLAKEAKILEAQQAKEAKVPKTPKEKKKKKRSPSPPVNESDYPPEALVKPTVPYSVMIFDAITNSEAKKLSLPDLYRSIEKAHPYFKLRAATHGWQSSVRHNLRGCPELFWMVEKEGKGYLWGVKEGANVDKERKKRRGANSPTPSQKGLPMHSMGMQQAPGMPPNMMMYHPNGVWAHHPGQQTMQFHPQQSQPGMSHPLPPHFMPMPAAGFPVQPPGMVPPGFAPIMPPYHIKDQQSLPANVSNAPTTVKAAAPLHACQTENMQPATAVKSEGAPSIQSRNPQLAAQSAQNNSQVGIIKPPQYHIPTSTASSHGKAPIPNLQRAAPIPLIPSTGMKTPVKAEQKSIAAPIPSLEPRTATPGNPTSSQTRTPSMPTPMVMPQKRPAPPSFDQQQSRPQPQPPRPVVATRISSGGQAAASPQNQPPNKQTMAALAHLQAALTAQLASNAKGGPSTGATTPQIQALLQTINSAVSGGANSNAIKVLETALNTMKGNIKPATSATPSQGVAARKPMSAADVATPDMGSTTPTPATVKSPMPTGAAAVAAKAPIPTLKPPTPTGAAVAPPKSTPTTNTNKSVTASPAIKPGQTPQAKAGGTVAMLKFLNNMLQQKKAAEAGKMGSSAAASAGSSSKSAVSAVSAVPVKTNGTSYNAGDKRPADESSFSPPAAKRVAAGVAGNGGSN